MRSTYYKALIRNHWMEKLCNRLCSPVLAGQLLGTVFVDFLFAHRIIRECTDQAMIERTLGRGLEPTCHDFLWSKNDEVQKLAWSRLLRIQCSERTRGSSKDWELEGYDIGIRKLWGLYVKIYIQLNTNSTFMWKAKAILVLW
jgi:hypothetical protein